MQTVVRKCTPSVSCLSSPDNPDDPDDPATYSVSELSVRCVNEMCQCAVSVRNGCAETAGGNAQATFKKCTDNVHERD